MFFLDKKPSKLVKILDHQYTTVGFSWETLKGKDKAVAQVLKKVALAKDLIMYLGLVTINESGIKRAGKVSIFQDILKIQMIQILLKDKISQ